jgi:putative transposase
MSERVRMICERMNGAEGSVVDLALAYGVSRKTAHKWIKRYEAGSWEALQDRSRARHHQVNAISAEVVEKVLELRRRRPLWGAPKIRQKLLEMDAERCPAESTVSAILKRHGLTRILNRVRHATPTRDPLRHAQSPNDVWTIDVKGDFEMGDGVRCWPLTLCDACSRYFLLCQGYVHAPGFKSTQRAMELIFQECGLPTAIRSDNGTPFASCGLGGLSQLSAWWVRLGIRLERIEPGHPEQNGRHERVHRTLKEATARPPRAHFKAQQDAFDGFRKEYNFERPHEGLGQKTPAQIYTASPRIYPAKLPEQRGYPRDWHTRRVSSAGQVSHYGQKFRINDALANQDVGFKPVGDGLWAIYFEHLEIGLYDERHGHVKALPRLADPKPIQEDYAI